MKLYRAGAILLSIVCCVGNLPVTVLGAEIQQTAKEQTKEKSDSQKDTEEQKAEKLRSTPKEETVKKETTNQKQQITNKKQKENQEKAELSNEERERQIPVTSIEDFQKIGTEGYPLDGVYVLQNDIDGRNMESGENSETEPFMNSDEVFTGVIHGGGHTIANFNIKRAEEGEKNTSMFGAFGGRLEEICFLNIRVISEKKSGALLAERLEGAKLKNIMLAGKVELVDFEQQSKEGQEQRKAGTIALQTDGKNWEEFLKEENQKTKFTNLKAVTQVSDLSEELPKGISEIKTNPEYISTVEGIGEEIEAPDLERFQFVNWTVENEENSAQEFEGEITNPKNKKTKISGKEGKYRLKAVYEYELKTESDTKQNELKNNQKMDRAKDALVQENQNNSETQKEPVQEGNESGSMETAAPPVNSEESKTADSVAKHTAELVLEVPYIVGKDIKNMKKLVPIDNVFPKQIRAVMYLAPIDGVFPKYMEVGKKTDRETISITSWEQFKNIGNTDYNTHYFMNANYILKANIYSDGKAFIPIGTEESPFTGSFDGNGFEIDVSANPEIDTKADYNGLFGVVAEQETN